MLKNWRLVFIVIFKTQNRSLCFYSIYYHKHLSVDILRTEG